MAELFENDAELVQLLRNLINQTSQIAGPEAVAMSTAFVQMIKSFPKEYNFGNAFDNVTLKSKDVFRSSD